MNKRITPTEAGDAAGIACGFMLQNLPPRTAYEVGQALKSGTGTLETIFSAHSPTGMSMRLEFHSGKSSRVLFRKVISE